MGFAILPQVEYDAHETLGTVPADRDYVGFKGRLRKVPQALRGDRVAIRPCTVDGHYGVLFGAYQIANIDLTSKECVGDVPGQMSVMSPD